MEALNILFVGPDASAFALAADGLGEEGHAVECLASPFKALTRNTRSPADLTVIDVSRLDEQMLEVFEALKEVAAKSILLAATAPAARGRAARLLNLGSDAVIGLPADPEEIRALVRKLRARSVPAAGASADEKLEWLGQFAGGLAHNINNPLTTVMGYVQILRSGSDSESREQTNNILSIMLKECDRIAEIIKQLLLFSGNGNIQPRPVDVNRAVDAALLLASTIEQNDKIRTERSYEPGIPHVLADEEALKLACQHVAVNARQAMRDGGTLSVETGEDRAGHVVIRFRDTGPGIAPEKTGRIFEPFYSGKNGGSLGLGLAVTYGIIKGFGGTVRVVSPNGAGTTFQIELPVNT